MADAKKPKKAQVGPKPTRVRIEGDWGKAVGSALKKTRPTEGWPKPPKPGKG
jgi:hypothetical protein